MSLSIYKWNSPDEEEEVPGEGSGFSRAWVTESTDCGCGESWPIMKRTVDCILHTGSGTGGGSTKSVRGEGRMSKTSRIMRSYAVGSTLGGIGDPPSCVPLVKAVGSPKQIKALSTW